MIDRKKFYQLITPELFRSPLLPAQREGMEYVLDAARGLGLEELAYVLATVYHETGKTMCPVRETFASTDEQAVRRLEAAWKAGKLPWVKTPYWRPDRDGKTWFGRGYVQLTHRKNYERMSNMLGVDLIDNPDLALDPKVAAQILVEGMRYGTFTGRKLSDFLPGDYVQARRIVNGLDRAEEIAVYAEMFEKALRASHTARVSLIDKLIQIILRILRQIVKGK